MRFHLLILLGLLALFTAAAANPADAGIRLLTAEESERYEREQRERREREERERAERVATSTAAADLYFRTAREIAPGLVDPLIDYSGIAMAGPACDPSRPPRTHAILVGAGDVGIEHQRLKGPVNDVKLLEALLLGRDVDATNIHTLTDERANRSGMAEAFLKVLAEAGCHDRVLLHFSTHGYDSASFASLALSSTASGNPFRDEWSKLEKTTNLDDLRKAFANSEIVVSPAMAFFASNMFDAENVDVALMLNDDSELFQEIVLGRDVSDFMIAVHNKGAHAVVLLDTVNAAAANIQQRQRRAGDQIAWNFVYMPEASGADAEGRTGNRLLPGHGEFAVFYAAAADQTTPELQLPRDDPDAEIFGLFTYTVASAVSVSEVATPRAIALHVQQAYDASAGFLAHPRIESSDPDLVLIAEEMRAQSGESAIRILNPTPKRGAVSVERQEIEVEGVVDWPARVLGVHVGTQPAILDDEGRFSAKVPLSHGMNTVNVVAVTADSRMHRNVLEFVYEGDKKALEGEGRRYAVIIANQSYGGSTGFSPLATPFADADALEALLATKYGFETTIRLGNTEISLLLKDPTKLDIQRALHHIGRVAGEKDTVLVYYAGHGIYEPVTSTAYWVPADAEAGFEPSYLSAADISAAIQRIQAGSVVLISDSCYSGALIRGGGEAETVEDGERLQSLLRMQARRSRVVITSGNNEPVEDLGGRGHSVFARALLTGLERMEHEAFSARELFDGYILHAVTANADQEPQYRPLEKVGHEGGDFVFVRMPAASAAAQ